MERPNDFYLGMPLYQKNEGDKTYWVDIDEKGTFVFTFDKKKFYNLYADYPYELTAEQKEIFDKENPFWVDYFKDRK